MTCGHPYEDPEVAAQLMADELAAEQRQRDQNETLDNEALNDAPGYADRRGI